MARNRAGKWEIAQQSGKKRVKLLVVRVNKMQKALDVAIDLNKCYCGAMHISVMYLGCSFIHGIVIHVICAVVCGGGIVFEWIVGSAPSLSYLTIYFYFRRCFFFRWNRIYTFILRIISCARALLLLFSFSSPFWCVCACFFSLRFFVRAGKITALALRAQMNWLFVFAVHNRSDCA